MCSSSIHQQFMGVFFYPPAVVISRDSPSEYHKTLCNTEENVSQEGSYRPLSWPGGLFSATTEVTSSYIVELTIAILKKKKKKSCCCFTKWKIVCVECLRWNFLRYQLCALLSKKILYIKNSFSKMVIPICLTLLRVPLRQFGFCEKMTTQLSRLWVKNPWVSCSVMFLHDCSNFDSCAFILALLNLSLFFCCPKQYLPFLTSFTHGIPSFLSHTLSEGISTFKWVETL